MSNLLDYIEWRGDLPLNAVPFGEVDGLVLSQLAYICWEKAGLDESGVLLSGMTERIRDDLFKPGITAEDDKKLLPLAAASARYGQIRLGHFVSEFDAGEEKQFAAAAFLLPDETVFLSFRGTDGTQVGWKEDFNMAFSPAVPSQRRAAEYLSEVAGRFQLPIRVGGHSKGGNLAVYAAAAVPERVQDRITGVYCNDGPGFNESVEPGAGYERISDRLFAFVPQSSIIGMLMSHAENYKVVRSNSVSVLQHNPYTWQVRGGLFIREPALRKDSQFIEGVLKKWLAGVLPEERRRFVNALFDIFGAAEAKSFDGDLWASLLKNPKAYVSAVQNIDPETRRMMSNMLGELAKTAIRYQGETKRSGWFGK